MKSSPDPNPTARDHLRWLAASSGIDRRRIDAVLGVVGPGDVGTRRVGIFSLGMQQAGDAVGSTADHVETRIS